jgi:intein/homing endonuclease
MNDTQKQVILRSRQSISWFLENFGKVKHPSAGILPFKLFSYQKMALNAFKQHRFNIFKKCRQCFAGDQMVWGPNGPKRIDQINKGDLVYTLNYHTNAIEAVPVNDVYNNGISDNLVEVRSKSGHRSIATYDHEYLTNNGYIKAGDLIGNKKLIEINDIERYGYTPNHNDPILLGYLLTDGSTGRFVTFNNSCWKYLLEYQKCFKNRFGLQLTIRKHESGFKPESTKNYRLQTTCVAATCWADRYNILNKIKADKTIPSDVFKWDNKSIAVLINRMFAGDGWYSGGNCNEAGIGLESVTMLHQLKQLLTRFNINAVYYPRTTTTIPKLRIIGKDDFNRFVQYIGIYGKKPRNQITKGFFFNREKGDIKSIKRVKGDGCVYDLNVPPYNNYIVDGAVVHNCGISKVSGAFALWFAMFNPNKTILIVSRRDEDAKGFLKENVAFLFNNLPEWMQDIWAPRIGTTGRKGWNEHAIAFTNGTVIKSMTSHPDVLRSNASSLNIIDEAAFIQDMDVMWAAGYSTMTHGGSTIVISTCVAPDTLINTANGLCEIQDLAPHEYDGFDDGYYHTDYKGPDIVGIDGLEPATKFYKRPKEATKIVKTSCCYEFEASLLHKLPVVSSNGTINNKYIQDLQIGDFLPVKAGQMVFGNNDILNYEDRNKSYRDDNLNSPIFQIKKMDEDIAYMLGVIIAEGHVRETIRKNGKITAEVVLSCGDSKVLDRCESWGNINWNRGRKGQDYVTVCSSPMFVRFLKYLGVECTIAPFKTIPKRLLQCSEPIIRNFLRGLFDGDGAALTRKGQVCYTSTSKKLIKQVRMLLFNYGIHTYLEISPPGMTSFKRNNGETTTHDTRESYRLYVSNNFTNLFYDLIGFDLGRKQALQKNKTSVWSELMPPVVKNLLKQLKDTTDLSIAKMTKLGLAPNVLYGSRSRITKDRLASFMSKISYEGNDAYDSLIKLLEYDWFNEVKSLEDSEAEVYDFTLPNTHTFIGDCTVHANTNGVGNWYWGTWTEAEAGDNVFNPICVNWWDMDWNIEYRDSLSRELVRIAPRDGLRKCTTKEEEDKYGPYWSPWLEEQWRGLQEKGEGWKFNQEVLASFIGSGNTVITRSVLTKLATTMKEPDRVTNTILYTNPSTGESEELSFNEQESESGLWVWEHPIQAKPAKMRNNQIISPGEPPHIYVMGVDFATGKGKDYHALEILDAITMEQVAEMMVRCLPKQFLRFVDYLGRYYNNAMLVLERNNGGDNLIDALRHEFNYPNIWRKKDINDKPRPSSSTQRAMKIDRYGFFTTMASKPILNRLLIDYVRDEDDAGYKVYSRRLLKQFNTYVRKRDKSGRDTGKTEAEEGANNFDDLVMAFALALVAINDSFALSSVSAGPVLSSSDFTSLAGPTIFTDDQMVQYHKQLVNATGNPFLPFVGTPDEMPEQNIQRQLDAFTYQLGAIPMSKNGPIVTPPKYYFKRKGE